MKISTCVAAAFLAVFVAAPAAAQPPLTVIPDISKAVPASEAGKLSAPEEFIQMLRQTVALRPTGEPEIRCAGCLLPFPFPS